MAFLDTRKNGLTRSQLPAVNFALHGDYQQCLSLSSLSPTAGRQHVVSIFEALLSRVFEVLRAPKPRNPFRFDAKRDG